MRKWAYLAELYEYNGNVVRKVMVHETEFEDVYVYIYNSAQAQICFADEWFPSVADAEDTWGPMIAAPGWVLIDDPLPGCQNDCFLPIRVKGRDTGNPAWGSYELYKDGHWVEYRE